MDNFSVGEVGGIFAGVVALLAALGKGLAWLLNHHGERSDAKSARLREWEKSLDRREKESREAMELRFRGLERAVIKLRNRTRAMRECLQEVTTELRVHAPDSAAADRAESILRAAWAETLDFNTPDDLSELARLLDDDDEEENGR